MRNRTTAEIVILIAALGLASCSSSSSPSAPAVAVYPLSGVVSEETPTGLVHVEGVLVIADNQETQTNKDGFYNFVGIHAVENQVLASKWGYDNALGRVAITGPTMLNLAVVRSAVYSLSGLVFEMTETGQSPIAGVSVYCGSCGEFGTFASTDADGLYSFPAVYPGKTPLLVKRTGYAVVNPTHIYSDGSGEKDPVVKGNTRFDIQLARP